MIIKEGAFFIADSHYNNKRKVLFELLHKIDIQKNKETQLFLMGDIFDFLCDEIDYFQDINQGIINLINEMSHHMEIIYFEGNHDFNLEETFPKVNVIRREEQPVYVIQNKKKIALAHGDIFTPKSYNIFTAIFRNSFLLYFLNIIDIHNWLTKFAERKLKSKQICHPQKNFVNFVAHRIENYDVDLVIEGHFHQGYQDDKYINLPSLACDGRYMIYQDKQFNFIRV